MLVRPKDKLEKENTTGPVYHTFCDDCDASYIGETERTMRTRFMEHKRRSSVNSEVSKHIHQDHKDHTVTLDKTKILSVDHRWFERGVKEAIYIRTNKPSLNADGGRYKTTVRMEQYVGKPNSNIFS